MDDQHQRHKTASLRHPLDVRGSVELAVLERSGMIESRHIGAAAVVASDGTLLRSVGDVTASVYPRSCLKPFQALAVMRSGVELEGTEAVLAMASHAGTPAHQAIVNDMLARAGATVDDLLCPPDWPYDRETARTAPAKTRMFMNCSGKHAGFLMACDVNGWDRSTYDDLDHPLQVMIRETIAEYTGEEVDHAGVDGCGAPVFAITLRGLATGVSRLTHSATTDQDRDAGRLVRAVLADAWALDGPGRVNTVTIDELGLLAKLGAEGVMVMGTTDGVAVAVKVLDGSLRAGTIAALQLLLEVGAVDPDAARRVLDRTLERVLGGGVPVGSIRAGAGLVTA